MLYYFIKSHPNSLIAPVMSFFPYLEFPHCISFNHSTFSPCRHMRSSFLPFYRLKPLPLASFKHSELRTLGTAVLFQFSLSRKDGFSCHHFSFRCFSAYTDRKFRRTRTWMLVFSENVFYDTVFQRMKGDDTKSSTVI